MNKVLLIVGPALAQINAGIRMAETRNLRTETMYAKIVPVAVQSMMEGLCFALLIMPSIAEQAKQEIPEDVRKTEQDIDAMEIGRNTVQVMKERMNEAIKILITDLGYPEYGLADIQELVSSL